MVGPCPNITLIRALLVFCQSLLVAFFRFLKSFPSPLPVGVGAAKTIEGLRSCRTNRPGPSNAVPQISTIHERAASSNAAAATAAITKPIRHRQSARPNPVSFVGIQAKKNLEDFLVQGGPQRDPSPVDRGHRAPSSRPGGATGLGSCAHVPIFPWGSSRSIDRR